MSPMALLLLLLVLAYIGSLWASSGRTRAFGSPSGIEYAALGLLLGPNALGVLGQGAIAELRPVAIVALGWIGLVFGLECGIVGARRASFKRLALGLFFTLVTAGLTVWVAWWLLGWFGVMSAQRAWMSAAVGLVSAETTRHAVRWIGERQPLSGPLSELLLDLAAADDAPVLFALALFCAELSGPRALFGRPIAPVALAATTIATGALLGLIAAWLLGRASSPVERWTILLGATWLATGMANSLGLSAVAATFALGLTLSAASRDAPRLRAQVVQTEGAVLLPALLLAGPQLDLPRSAAEVALVGGALGVRVAMSFVCGFALSFARRELRGLGHWLGGGMLASGSLTMIVGFALSLRCPSEIARPALAIAFLGTLLGEVIGPAALRRALVHSSEPPAPAGPHHDERDVDARESAS